MKQELCKLKTNILHFLAQILLCYKINLCEARIVYSTHLSPDNDDPIFHPIWGVGVIGGWGSDESEKYYLTKLYDTFD